MPAIHHHKLVRDRIPEIITASGKTCVTRILDDAAYIAALDAKLTEELANTTPTAPWRSWRICWKS